MSGCLDVRGLLTNGVRKIGLGTGKHNKHKLIRIGIMYIDNHVCSHTYYNN